MWKKLLISTVGLAAAGVANGQTAKRQWNVSINPLSTLVGAPVGAVDYRVADRAWAGVYGAYTNFLGITSTTIGVRSHIKPNSRADRDGVYLSPSLYYSVHDVDDDINSDSTLVRIDGSGTTLGVAGILGYHWIWKSGLNLRLGLGAQVSRASVDTSVRVDDSANEGSATATYTGMTGEFALGLAI